MSTVIVDQNQTVVVVAGGSVQQVRQDRTQTAVVSEAGPRGPAGPSGAEEDSFDFVQLTPVTEWSISHNLGRRPIVELFSAGGVEIDADVHHISLDQVIVYFNSPTAGSARLI